MKADVVVIGAGPAGCSAAYWLASGGAQVILLDRCEFPRGKVCGDALSPHSLVELRRMGLGELAAGAHRVVGGLLVAPNGLTARTRAQDFGAAVERRLLDSALLEHARAAGAQFVPRQRVIRIEPAADSVSVETAEGRRFEGRCGVLATGANTAALHAAGLARRPSAAHAFGRRAYFEHVDCPDDLVVHCFERFLLPGYGWFFPLGGGRANVGVAAHCRPGSRMDMARRFERFASGPVARRFLRHARQVSLARTAPLHTGLRGGKLARGALVAVGEAAGAVTPANGEGVVGALTTGRLAAEALLPALRSGSSLVEAGRGYARAVRALYGGPYRQAEWVRRTLRAPEVMDLFVRAVRGDDELADRMVWMLAGVTSARELLSPALLLRLARGIAMR